RNRARFRWSKGPVVEADAFGDPSGGEPVELCIYDQTEPGSYELALAGSPWVIPPQGWTQTATGWRFRSATGAPDGITSILLSGSTTPLEAKLQVKAINSPLLGSLPLSASPSVIAQLRTSSGACWSATFSTPSVNTMTEFKADSD